MACSFPDDGLLLDSSKTKDNSFNKHKFSQFRETMSALNSFRLEDSFCDVTIDLQNRTFRAHKIVLAAASGYFRAMLMSGYSESYLGEVTLEETPDLNADCFALLLDFMYTGELPICLETVTDVVAGAIYLQMNHAIQVCANSIRLAAEKGRLTAELLFKILSMTSPYGAPDIRDVANHYLAIQFSTISKTKSFLRCVTFQTMCELLDRNDLVGTSESGILDVVLSWLRYDWDLRKVYTVDLLSKIRLGLLTLDKLTTVFEDQLQEIPECRDLYNDILKYHAFGNQRRESRFGTDLHKDMFTPRGNFVKGLIFIDSQKEASYFFRNDTRSLSHCNSFSMQQVQPGHRAVVAKGHLYCAGRVGLKKDEHHNDGFMMRYNVEQNRWIRCTAMNTARSNFGFIYFDGYLYVVCGEGVWSQALDSVERYHISSGKWEKLPRLPFILEQSQLFSLPNRSTMPSVAIYQHCILVAGHTAHKTAVAGVSGDLIKRSLILLFDTTRSAWHSLNSAYLGFGSELHVYVANDTIYLITFHTTQSRFTKSKNWNTCPAVCSCKCDLYSNPSNPIFTIELQMSQKCVPETNMRVFRIGSGIYIILRGLVYKTNVTVANGQVYDADMSQYQTLSQFDSDNYAAASYSLNKMK